MFCLKITFFNFFNFFYFCHSFFLFSSWKSYFRHVFFYFSWSLSIFYMCFFYFSLCFVLLLHVFFLLSGKQTPGPPPTRTTRHINYAPSVSACCKFTNSTQSQRGRESEGSHSERNISISTGMLLLPSLSFRVKQYACVGSGPTSLCCASWFWARCLKVHPCGRGNSTISDA